MSKWELIGKPVLTWTLKALAAVGMFILMIAAITMKMAMRQQHRRR